MSVAALLEALSREPEHRARIAEHARGVVDVRTVLLVHHHLCNRYKDRRGFVDETHAQLAAVTGEHERVVRLALAALEACGLWKTTAVGNQHRGTRRVPTFIPACVQADKQRRADVSVLDRQQRRVGTSVLDDEQRRVDRRAATRTAPSSDALTRQHHESTGKHHPSTAPNVRPTTNVEPAQPFRGREHLIEEAVSYCEHEAERQLAQHHAVEYGAARHPTAARAARMRTIEALRDQTREWLLDGRRPYDVATAIAARANGETAARPKSLHELGLDNA